MAEIALPADHLHRLLVDSNRPQSRPYQRAYEDLAGSHRGRPITDILSQLQRAATEAQLSFTPAALLEQAEAISAGRPCALRVRVTRPRTAPEQRTQGPASAM
ncbi:hypothetical protein [Streptomyces sp. NPDC002746]